MVNLPPDKQLWPIQFFVDQLKQYHIDQQVGKSSVSEIILVMQEASDALSKTADSDTVSIYQVSSVQLVTDKKLEAFNKA